MTDATIEEILFHAPGPAAPPDLLRELKAQIALPQSKPRVASTHSWRSSLRRWFPALAFSLFLLSCVVIVAVQTNWSAKLQQQNAAFQTATADLPQLREQHATLEKKLADRDELAQLRKDNDELRRLQEEVVQLRNLPGQIRQLQSENERLNISLAPKASASNDTFFDEAQKEAERVQCVNNLKQLGLACRVWAGDYNDKYSTSLVAMSNELSTVKVLICPSDKERQAYSNLGFDQFRDDMTSYQYLAQPDDETYPDCFIAKCPIHHNYLLADGSVQMINPAKVREVKKDGRWYLQRIDSNSSQ